MVKLKKYYSSVLLLLPALLIHTVLMVYPIFKAIYLSFFSWNGILTSAPKYIGLNNYLQMFTSEAFLRGLYNVGVFVLSTFLVTMPIAFVFALIITSKIKGSVFFKTVFFIPAVISQTAVALMWSFIFYPQGGLLNNLLTYAGLSSWINDWLGNPQIAIFSVVLVNSWVSVGLNMIILAAGLVSIPEETYQASRIDGAGYLATLWYVTIPMMKDTFNIYVVLNLIGCIKAFEIVFVMTRGGPNGATDVPVTLLYKYAFQYNYFGYGNSIGTFVLIAAIIITVTVNRLFREKT